MARKATAPWYAHGLCFTCQPDCGRCCTNHDDYALVYLEGDDVARLAAHFALSEDAFKQRYTVLDEGSLVLQSTEPACPFLEDLRCGVYDARPRQCRTFPFWPEHLASRVTWEAVGRFCPGIGLGEAHPLHVIEKIVAEHER